MANINWKVRLQHKWFWITIVPAILLLIQQICGIFGVTIDIAILQGQLLAVIDTIFVVLSTLGIIVDMTTEGIGDSERALGYDKPYENDPEASEFPEGKAE